MNKQAPVLQISHLSAGYGGHDVIADISLELLPGQILCVVGESGCGKSTLLRAILQMDTQIVQSGGEVILEGQALSALPLRQRRQFCCARLGMVFQNPGESFNPIRTYRRQFTEAMKSHDRFDPSSFESKTAATFEKLGLKDADRLLASCPFEMSGGMNQRIALALSLLLGQRILLEDEPTSALDAGVQRQVSKELKKLAQRDGVAQLIVTHNLALAQYLSDRIAVLYAGQIVEYGETEQVLRAPAHPYTRALMAAIPHLGDDLPKGIDGLPPLNGSELPGCAFADRCTLAGESCAAIHPKLSQIAPGHFVACSEGIGGIVV